MTLVALGRLGALETLEAMEGTLVAMEGTLVALGGCWWLSREVSWAWWGP